MWVEADTNVSGGGADPPIHHWKAVFKDEFGIDTELMWLPDVFGYSGAVPQIMRRDAESSGSARKRFSGRTTGAIHSRTISSGGRGLTGRILSYLHNDYNSFTHPQAIMSRWRERVQKDAVHNARLVPFGHGDGGNDSTARAS